MVTKFREYQFGELITGTGGNDFGIIQTPFSVLPIEDESGCFYGHKVTISGNTISTTAKSCRW
jgi:hypothetical protein